MLDNLQKKLDEGKRNNKEAEEVKSDALNQWDRAMNELGR